MSRTNISAAAPTAAAAADAAPESGAVAMRTMLAQMSRQQKSKWLIDPRTSSRLAGWDLAGGVALIYTALLTPFEVAFLDLPDTPASAQFVINRLIDLFFIADMIIQLFIMYPEQVPVAVDSRKTHLRKTGILAKQQMVVEMVTKHRAIACHYFSTWFAIDVISVLTMIIDIVPVYLASQRNALDVDSAATDRDLVARLDALRVLRVLRVLRLIKLVRLLKSSRILKRWETSISLDFSMQTVIKCLLLYLIAGHWFACVLVLTASLSSARMLTWLGAKGYCVQADEADVLCVPGGFCYSREFAMNGESVLHHGANWIKEPVPLNPALRHLDNVYCVSPWDLWCLSYYWMMQLISGAAGGDTNQRDIQSYEALVFTVLVVIACLIMSQIVASFCDVLSNMNPEHTQFRNQMDHLNRYCRANRLHSLTRRQLREYLYRAKHVQVANSQRELMLLMSPKLQGELSLQVNGPWLTTVPFLQHTETACSVRIAFALEPMVFIPTELLPADSMYYLFRGTVVHRGNVLISGAVWGSDCILSREDLRARPARALSYAEVSRIHRENLVEIVQGKVAAADSNGNPVERYQYPAAARKLRWEAVRLSLVREAARLRAAANPDGLKGWSATFLAMEMDQNIAIEETLEEAPAPASAREDSADGRRKSVVKRAAGSAKNLLRRQSSGSSAKGNSNQSTAAPLDNQASHCVESGGSGGASTATSPANGDPAAPEAGPSSVPAEPPADTEDGSPGAESSGRRRRSRNPSRRGPETGTPAPSASTADDFGIGVATATNPAAANPENGEFELVQPSPGQPQVWSSTSIIM